MLQLLHYILHSAVRSIDCVNCDVNHHFVTKINTLKKLQHIHEQSYNIF